MAGGDGTRLTCEAALGIGVAMNSGCPAATDGVAADDAGPATTGGLAGLDARPGAVGLGAAYAER